jgi:hypothetical protein
MHFYYNTVDKYFSKNRSCYTSILILLFISFLIFLLAGFLYLVTPYSKCGFYTCHKCTIIDVKFHIKRLAKVKLENDMIYDNYVDFFNIECDDYRCVNKTYDCWQTDEKMHHIFDKFIFKFPLDYDCNKVYYSFIAVITEIIIMLTPVIIMVLSEIPFPIFTIAMVINTSIGIVLIIVLFMSSYIIKYSQ